MNQLDFRIEDWIAGDDPDPRRAGSNAEFTLIINDIAATKLYDSWSRTVTDRARLPLYPLAEWLAINWWRLHAEVTFEASGPPPTHWRLSHDLPGIGGGAIWPRVRFASDDRSILVSARAVRNAPWEPIRHLNDIPPTPISYEHFDKAAEGLILSVLARLNELGVSAEPLTTIWMDLCAERDDAELTDWRIWEARLGYDPDNAPEKLMGQISELFGRAGRSAASEVIPLLGKDNSFTIEQIDMLAHSPGLKIQPLEIHPHLIHGEPWEIGRTLAHHIRQSLPKATGPISDAVLLDILGAPSSSFDNLTAKSGPLSLGVRHAENAEATLHFRRRNRPGIRFEAARFTAEIITANNDDSWLPLTDRGTARQKMQRAFAAELLSPIAEISELISNEYTTERFEEVGDLYGVSPLAIRSQLANHGFFNMEESVL